MLPAKNHLSLREDPTFFDHAKKHFFPFGVVFYVVSEINSTEKEVPALLDFRATSIIPKKYWNKATDRNYLKRVVTSAVWKAATHKQVVQNTHGVQSLHMAVFLSKKPKEDHFEKIVSEMERFFETILV